MIEFEQARDIVERTGAGKPRLGTYHVATWGFEDDTRYRVVTGNRESLVEGRVELTPMDLPVVFVDKASGQITTATRLDVMTELAAMRPCGVGAPG